MCDAATVALPLHNLLMSHLISLPVGLFGVSLQGLAVIMFACNARQERGGWSTSFSWILDYEQNSQEASDSSGRLESTHTVFRTALHKLFLSTHFHSDFNQMHLGF